MQTAMSGCNLMMRRANQVLCKRALLVTSVCVCVCVYKYMCVKNAHGRNVVVVLLVE